MGCVIHNLADRPPYNFKRMNDEREVVQGAACHCTSGRALRRVQLRWGGSRIDRI